MEEVINEGVTDWSGRESKDDIIFVFPYLRSSSHRPLSRRRRRLTSCTSRQDRSLRPNVDVHADSYFKGHLLDELLFLRLKQDCLGKRGIGKWGNEQVSDVYVAFSFNIMVAAFIGLGADLL